VQSDRASLSDEAFCQQTGLEPLLVPIVSLIRSRLASLGAYDPFRVYPEDDFWPHFRLEYDDDVACFVQGIKVIRGYKDYSFPLQEVDTVADFVRVVWRLKNEAESGKANGRQSIRS